MAEYGFDGYIIRYRKKGEEWTYEICTNDDVECYEEMRDYYRECGDKELSKIITEYDHETVTSGNITISNDMLKWIRKTKNDE